MCQSPENQAGYVPHERRRCFQKFRQGKGSLGVEQQTVDQVNQDEHNCPSEADMFGHITGDENKQRDMKKIKIIQRQAGAGNRMQKVAEKGQQNQQPFGRIQAGIASGKCKNVIIFCKIFHQSSKGDVTTVSLFRND